MSSTFYSFSEKNSTSIFRVEEFSVWNRKAGHYFDNDSYNLPHYMAVDVGTQFIGHRHEKIRCHIYPCLSVLWVEFHHYFLFLCCRWQLNEIVVQEVAVTLQVSKVRHMKRNKKRRRKRRTEGLVCSVQMCDCLWVAAIMGHKDTNSYTFWGYIEGFRW